MKRLLVFMLLTATPSAQADIYTWTDGRRIVHYTNKEYEIPARYKTRAKPLHIEAVQAGTSSASPATPQQPPPSQPAPQPQDQPVSPQVTPQTPAPQPAVAPSGAPPAQNVPIQPRGRGRVRSGDE